METPDGEWIQDSSEIIDYCEKLHTKTTAVPVTPRQRLAAYLVELLADEWLVVPACWERWYYSRPSQQPNHLAFNAQQWGSFQTPREAAQHEELPARDFERVFGINDTENELKAPMQD